MAHPSPLALEALTPGGAQCWAYLNLVDEPQQDGSPDWLCLADLAVADQQKLAALCLDQDMSFPGLVNGQPSVIVEQEFQSRDSGDDWPETTPEVQERLTRNLLPRLELPKTPGAFAGVIADRATTFCGRPVVWVVLPADAVTASDVRSVEQQLRAFAYPAA